MSTTLQTNELTLRTSIIQKINLIFNDEEYTFEAFILMKGNHILKKFVLYEGVPQRRNDTSVNFKKKLQLSIAESIRRKFADESAEYDHVDNIANNQNKFYVIPQTTDYSPFAAVCTTIQTYDSYRVTDRENAEGIFFRYQRGEHIIWAYQYFWPNAIPNRKGLAFHVILLALCTDDFQQYFVNSVGISALCEEPAAQIIQTSNEKPPLCIIHCKMIFLFHILPSLCYHCIG